MVLFCNLFIERPSYKIIKLLDLRNAAVLLQSYATILNIDKKTLWSPKYTVYSVYLSLLCCI